MERGYVDTEANQAICCWSAPSRASVEELFAKAQLKPESIREVVEYSGS